MEQLSPEQHMLRDTARSLLETECPSELVRSCLDTGRMARGLWEKLGRAGLLGIGLPEAIGGSGGTVIEFVIAAGEFGRALAPVPWFGTALASRLALIAPGLDTDAVGAALQGRSVLSVAIPDLWWNPLLAPQAEVTPEQLTVPWGAEADHIVGLGGTAVQPIVSLDSKPYQGLEIREYPALGTDSYSWAQRTAQPAGAVPVDPDAVRTVLTEMRVARCAEMMAGARRVLEIAVDYAKERRQFGRPIGSFQAVKHRLADMATDVELADLLVWEAARAVATGDGSAWEEAAMAKALSGEAYRRVAAGACQVLGGYGFMLEYDPQLYFRRAKQAQLLEGSSEDLYVAIGSRAVGYASS
ncbi:MAG: acyl-CoA dehydrogenase family protein [Actinomycetota bacterium]